MLDRIKVDTTEFLDCGEKAAAWINKYLGCQGLKVGFSSPDIHKRDATTAQKLWEHNAQKGDMVRMILEVEVKAGVSDIFCLRRISFCVW